MDDWCSQVPSATAPKLVRFLTKQIYQFVYISDLISRWKWCQVSWIWGTDGYLAAAILSQRVCQVVCLVFVYRAESRVTKKGSAACLWSECGLFNLWPSCMGKMKGCNFPYLMVIMTSLRCPQARFFYRELPPRLLTVAAKSGYDRGIIPLEGKLLRHTVITKGHLIKIDLRLLICYKW